MRLLSPRLLGLAAVAGLTLSGLGMRSAPPPATAQSSMYIDMRNNAYLPDYVVVAAGTAVTWGNSEADASVTHDVVADGMYFASPNIYAGTSWTWVFDTPGTYTYFCTFHEGQSGVIVVQ